MARKKLECWQYEMDNAVEDGNEKKIAALNLLKEFVGSTVTLRALDKFHEVNDPDYWWFQYARDLGIVDRDAEEEDTTITDELKDKVCKTELEVIDIMPRYAMFGGGGIMLTGQTKDGHATCQWSNDFNGIPGELITKWLKAVYA